MDKNNNQSKEEKMNAKNSGVICVC